MLRSYLDTLGEADKQGGSLERSAFDDRHVFVPPLGKADL